MNCSIFWGILLVLIGLSLIIKVVFNIELPVIKIFVAFFLIYLGIKLFVKKDIGLFGHHENENSVIFGERTFRDIQDGSEYNFIFSKGIMDMRDISDHNSQDLKIKLNTIFAASEVIINDSLNFVINSNTAFGVVKMPDGRTTAFGSLTYKSDTVNNKPRIRIETNTVFGSTIFRKSK